MVNKKYYNKAGYFHGRFQPFHLGHLDVVKYILELCNLLVIGISNPFRTYPYINESYNQEEIKSLEIARNPENNPFPYWARVFMIRQGLKEEGVDLSKILFIPNLNDTGLPINEIRLPKELTIIFICPKDAHNKAKVKSYLDKGWRVIEVPVSEKCPGSAVIREAIKNGGQWEMFVPKGTAKFIKKYLEEKLYKLKIY